MCLCPTLAHSAELRITRLPVISEQQLAVKQTYNRKDVTNTKAAKHLGLSVQIYQLSDMKRF